MDKDENFLKVWVEKIKKEMITYLLTDINEIRQYIKIFKEYYMKNHLDINYSILRSLKRKEKELQDDINGWIGNKNLSLPRRCKADTHGQKQGTGYGDNITSNPIKKDMGNTA